MIKTETIYYRGELNCQFSTQKSRKIGSTSDLQSPLKLEPRYRLYKPVLIEETEVPDKLQLSGMPYLVSQVKSNVEFYFEGELEPEKKSTIKQVDEIILILEKSALVTDNHKIHHFDSYLHSPHGLSDFYKNFFAAAGKITHGKIKGYAILKIVKKYEVPDPVVKTVQTTDYTRIDQHLNPAKDPNDKVTIIGDEGTVNPTKPTPRGCLSMSSFNQKGCIPFPWLNNSGCLLPLILLLLAGLLYSLFGRKDHGGSGERIVEKIIHDTVKLEVIRERVDTLTVTKLDTVSYFDSTVKKKFEAVSLPNVQYYTNSDVLLPSSASDLQKLAEYLIKNDSLNATIIGHTDNVGDHESNMKLSQRRAESVKRFLNSLGVNSNRLKAVGLGDTKPKADNKTNEGRLMNRRVEVQLENTEQSSTKRIKLDQKDNKPTNR